MQCKEKKPVTAPPSVQPSSSSQSTIDL